MHSAYYYLNINTFKVPVNKVCVTFYLVELNALKIFKYLYIMTVSYERQDTLATIVYLDCSYRVNFPYRKFYFFFRLTLCPHMGPIYGEIEDLVVFC